jgi:hypothetical protein
VYHHQIAWIEPGGHHQPAPLQVVDAPAQARGIGLALHAVELVPPFEAHPFGAAHQQPVGGAIGTRGELLEDVAVQMLAQPGVPELLGIRLQRTV